MDAAGNGASTQLVTIQELSARSRLSVATLHRLKNQGKIRFYQPAGKRGRLLFPVDAIERTAEAGSQPSRTPSPAEDHPHLGGPLPAWMRPSP